MDAQKGVVTNQLFFREWPFITGRGWGGGQDNLEVVEFFLNEGEGDHFFRHWKGVNEFFHVSLANIFNKCYEKCVFIKKTTKKTIEFGYI